jgi:hypothetical protein
MPEPLGKPVEVHCFMAADHAGILATCRSHPGIIIFLNKSPTLWYSKRQNKVELSTFGSEFVALRTAVEIIIGLRYKLVEVIYITHGNHYCLGILQCWVWTDGTTDEIPVVLTQNMDIVKSLPVLDQNEQWNYECYVNSTLQKKCLNNGD